MRARLHLTALAMVTIAMASQLWGCAASAPPPPTAFVPETRAGVQTLYRNGAAYAALANPRGPVLVTLRPLTLADRAYVRLWLHVQNRQARTFRIGPEDIYLERRARDGGVKRIEPESEGDVLALMQSRGVGPRGVLLHRTAVPPGESLQGEVYFPFPGPPMSRRRAYTSEAYAYDVTLHLPTPDGPKRIVLKPVPART